MLYWELLTRGLHITHYLYCLKTKDANKCYLYSLFKTNDTNNKLSQIINYLYSLFQLNDTNNLLFVSFVCLNLRYK